MKRTGMLHQSLVSVASGLLTVVAQAASVQVTVLDRDGQPLPDAVVVVDSAAAVSSPHAAPAGKVTIVQQGMQFVPALSVVPVGSKVRFTNLDNWDHHVRAMPAGAALVDGADASAGFALRLAGKRTGQAPASMDVVLGQSGPWQLGCHIHGTMRGFVYVANNPWTAKTDDKGMAVLQDLPEGAAKISVWHPYQLVDMPVTAVVVKAATSVTVSTPVKPRRRR
jgi:plastocyanin